MVPQMWYWVKNCFPGTQNPASYPPFRLLPAKLRARHAGDQSRSFRSRIHGHRLRARRDPDPQLRQRAAPMAARSSRRCKDRYRVIAVNLFGYGNTSPWPAARPLTAADQAELVAAAAALAPEPVALVGHSLGGAVALEAAAQLGDRVRVVIVFEPILFGHLEAHGPADAYDEIASWRAASMSWRRPATGTPPANCSSTTGPRPAPGQPCRTSAGRTRSRCCRRSCTNGRWRRPVSARLRAGAPSPRPFT